MYVSDVNRTGESAMATSLQFKVTYRDEKGAEVACAIAVSVRLGPETR